MHCKPDMNKWRVVLRFCIQPLHGAIVLLAIMDISARAISLAENRFRTLFPESFGAEVGWRNRNGNRRNCMATGGGLYLYQQKHGGEIMWIMLSDCFLSVVSKDCGPDELLVRARRPGDIEKAFPDARVTRNTQSDYLYRAVLPRDLVKEALAAMIDNVDYPNFKDTVEDRSLYAAYVGVWCAMAGLQHPPPYIPTQARSALTSKNTP